MSRADVLRKAWSDYHARRISLPELLRAVATWRRMS